MLVASAVVGIFLCHKSAPSGRLEVVVTENEMAELPDLMDDRQKIKSFGF